MSNDQHSDRAAGQRETAAMIIDLLHRTMVHHVLWFTEVRHQMGQKRALELLHEVFQNSYDIQMKHLAELFGFKMLDTIPEPLLHMEPDQLARFKERVAKNWLVNDGIWFQAIERAEGLNEAKRCNDSCWAHFSPFEASVIKRRLGLPEQAGLDGLKQALGLRVYACINRQSISDESPVSFVFRMDECRVQQARMRKGLADYPCKSAGLVEYSYFARTIDERIRTECIGCPPDDHPPEWFCAWRFILEE
ncbi:DUF6125 family protein [Desulfofustis limnaeus]|jgi:hypothetical protein|uniref:Cytosolic protein n=1 Tax=Desulfofustis limnaeus TaxID=2740163 RepID=A0ABM7WDC4_9BACT|nr:DUF6125 family protein [Desulfofustis limnaeus]MDX9894006.1 DUF6125 family protein [Desulfofustis sp.]BDD88951.1 hypothetical protein DPPLL_33160 [Desulfofustis limnaeus]